MRAPKILIAIAALALAGGAEAQSRPLPACLDVVKIFGGTTLAGLADRYFADIEYRHAILLATNARVSEGFPLILDPNRLPAGKSLCIPQIGEAERLKNRFVVYERAVRDMMLPYPSEVATDLDRIESGGPVGVVTWIRAGDVGTWQSSIGQTMATRGDTWVTLTPHLQAFCAGYVAAKGDDPEGLTLRLEQRLGLPPHSAKTHMVEFEVSDPLDRSQLFRPCADPDVTTESCAFAAAQPCGDPDALDDDGTPLHGADEQEEIRACNAHYDFFTRQYYTSYGVTHPTEYPWTSLGYTFDWAHRPVGLGERSEFEQYGESEYVVPEGVTVRVTSVTPTLEYCTPR